MGPDMYFHEIQLWIKVLNFEYQFLRMQFQLPIISITISKVEDLDAVFFISYFLLHLTIIYI